MFYLAHKIWTKIKAFYRIHGGEKKKPVISHDDDFQFMEFSLALGSVTYQVVVFSKLNTLLPFVELGFFLFLVCFKIFAKSAFI